MPESLVLAMTSARNGIEISLITMLFAVNFVNSMCQFLDLLEAKPRQIVYSIIMASLLFCMGALMTQAAGILDRLSLQDRDAAHLSVLFVGVFVGCVLILVLLKVEHVHHERHLDRRALEMDSETVATITSLQKLLSREREQFYNISHNAVGPEDQARVLRQGKRLSSVTNVIRSLEHARGLSRSMNVDSRVVHDARNAVFDLLDEKLEKWMDEAQRSEETASDRESSGPSLRQSSMQDRDPLLLSGADDGESNTRPNHHVVEDAVTIGRKARKAIIMFVGVACWSVIVAFAFTPLFSYLFGDPLYGFGNAFVEGLSAGGFLAKVSGIMIPRVQFYSNRSAFAEFRKQIIMIVAFVLGAMVTTLLQVLIPGVEEIPLPGLNHTRHLF